MKEETETKLTSIQTDSKTSRRLALVAKAYERSKAAQLRVLVNREYAELERLKLLPVIAINEETSQDTQTA
jgi:hypothetical protein